MTNLNSEWDKVDFGLAIFSLTTLWDNEQIDACFALEEFIQKVQLIRDKQVKANNRNIPALLRK